MSDQSFLRYQSAINRLLMDFQWIEMSLRLVIGGSYDVLRRSAPSPVTFRPKKGALSRDALGRLIEKYSEVSLNTDTAEKLKGLLKDRNFCAHQSFILTVDEQTDLNFLETEADRLESVKSQTRELVLSLQMEFNALAKLLNEKPAELAAREAVELDEADDSENDA